MSVTNAGGFAALRHLTDVSHLLFGSDYPFLPASVTANELAALDLSVDDRDAIERRNALALFPRLNSIADNRLVLPAQ